MNAIDCAKYGLDQGKGNFFACSSSTDLFMHKITGKNMKRIIEVSL